MRIFLATKNPGKREELQRLLGPGFELVKIDPPHVDEGLEMEANARKKAIDGYKTSKVVSIGEDSGLFIRSLDGRPGPLSSRYGSSDSERIARVLAELKPFKDRSAYFLSIIALALNEKTIKIFKGRVDGRISTTPLGNSGFGYDPIFIPDGYDQTFGLLGPEVKDRISHRAMAVRNLKDFLQDYRGVAQPG